MSRFLPQTLLGQVLLVLALGLLGAQLVSASLLFRASEQRRELTIINELALRFVNAEQRGAEIEQRRARRQARAERRGLPIPPERDSGFRAGVQFTNDDPLLPGDKRYGDLEPLLKEVLAEQGIVADQVRIVRRKAGADPFIATRPRLRDRIRGPDWRSRNLAIAALQRPDTAEWEVARTIYRERPREGLYTLLLQTAVTFAILFSLMYFMMRRITRPLASLTQRVDAFSRNPDQAVRLKESGPQDTRQLIAAHNAMEARVAALLDEKDVMLGAIGHDLKTPLAALRVRIESVPDDTQRARMAQSIEDITHTLDDILSLARVGRSGIEAESVDLAALTAGVVEEFEDLGEPVTLVENARLVREVQTTWLKRALRNLVSNAVRYGKEARVSLLAADGKAVLRIDDIGPGIPPGDIAGMLEPFRRGETSRNRATGGAGLGLTLARAIAEQHGGTLSLSNRMEEGEITGLRTEITLP